jgi:hypothetical protein
MELIPNNDEVIWDSTIYHLKNGKDEIPISPGATVYKNALGGTAICFAGSPRTNFTYTEFGFLTETRKAQMIQILTDLDALPVYYPEDAEVLMKAAQMRDGRMLCAILNMTLDMLPDFPLVIRKDVKSIKRLCPDGSYAYVDFTRDGDLYTLDLTVGIFDPLILTIE